MKINPFDDWNKYADLCFLIKEKGSLFTEKEHDQMINWITSTSFGKEKEYIVYINSNKYEALKFLGEHSIKAKKTALALYNSEFDSFDVFSERNKLIRISSSFERIDEDILDEFKGLDPLEVFNILQEKKLNYEYEIYDYQNALTTYLQDENNLQKLLDNLDYVDNVPTSYLSCIINVLRETKLHGIDLKILEILDKIVNKLMTHEEVHTISSIIWTIRGKELFKKEPLKTYQICYSITNYTFNMLDEKEIDIQHSPATKLINIPFINTVEMLFISAINDDKKKMSPIPYLTRLLKSQKHSYLVKASLAENVKYVYQLNKDWINDNLMNILDNQYNDYNLSYVACIWGNGITEEIYNQIKSYPSFVEFIHNKCDDSEVKYSIEILMYYIINDFLVNNFKTIHVIDEIKFFLFFDIS